MPQYVTSVEFINSAYGADYAPGESIFEDYAQLDDFLVSISAMIDAYCGRSFDVKQSTDYFDGFSGNVLFLSSLPVSGISSITWKSVGGSSSGVINPNAYTLFNKIGKVRFASRQDSACGTKILEVNYTSGYDIVPEPIRQAALMLANAYAQAIDNGATAFADGGANVQFRFAKFQEQYADPRHKNPNYNQGIPVTVEAILRRYRYIK